MRNTPTGTMRLSTIEVELQLRAAARERGGRVERLVTRALAERQPVQAREVE